VFPYADGIRLDDEDGLALRARPAAPAPPGARTAIVRLPHVSNTTDFRLLTWADWIDAPPAGRYDFIVLPGTKNTISDLVWLRDTGLATWILEQRLGGATVVGICGGYQMLGRTVRDPAATESPAGEAAGLGLVPAVTTLEREKLTRTVRAATPRGAAFSGYEIHLGVTSVDRGCAHTPFARLSDGSADGVRYPGVIGTYLHGALEHPAVLAEIFGVDPPLVPSKAEQYQRLAEWFARHARHVERLGLI
jgi:adenosylcobyric acid synthase